jgi:hypothetical protein
MWTIKNKVIGNLLVIKPIIALRELLDIRTNRL